MYDEYSIKELDIDGLVEHLEQAEHSYDEDIHLEEIFPQGNIWAASPEEITEIIEEYPHLADYINF